MDVRVIRSGAVSTHTVEELPQLLDLGDGLLWVDVPVCDAAAAGVLGRT